MTSPHHEEYRYQETIFRKEYLPNGEVVFLKNNQPLTLAEWNREVNALHPQSLKANNRNIIIRWLEQQRRRSFLKFVNAQPTDHIADIGCETGFMVHALAPKTAKVVGIDIDEAMLELAREAAHHPNVEFKTSDLYQLDLPDAHFDKVICSEVLEHIPEVERAISELIRITKPGGYIYISLPNDSLILFTKRLLRLFRVTWLLQGLSEQIAIGHVRVYTKANFLQLLQSIPGAKAQRAFYNPPFFLTLYVQLKCD